MLAAALRRRRLTGFAAPAAFRRRPAPRASLHPQSCGDAAWPASLHPQSCGDGAWRSSSRPQPCAAHDASWLPPSPQPSDDAVLAVVFVAATLRRTRRFVAAPFAATFRRRRLTELFTPAALRRAVRRLAGLRVVFFADFRAGPSSPEARSPPFRRDYCASDDRQARRSSPLVHGGLEVGTSSELHAFDAAYELARLCVGCARCGPRPGTLTKRRNPDP